MPIAEGWVLGFQGFIGNRKSSIIHLLLRVRPGAGAKWAVRGRIWRPFSEFDPGFRGVL
jgi:hypothetical protein